MAIVRIPEEQRSIDDPAAIAAFLAPYGIDFERWHADVSAAANATAAARDQ